MGPGLHRLSLEVPAAVSSGFHAPGQYHRVRVPSGDDAPFSFASAPGTNPFEYFIRESDGVAGELTALPVGETVRVGHPEGPGFPVEKARAHDLLVIGTGTGFAPLRSVLLTILQKRRQYRQVHGLWGVLTPAHLAFGAELPGFEKAGVHITPTVTTTGPGWKGAVGQVQELIDTLPVENAVAFLCGQHEMVRTVTDLLGRRGLPADRVFLNF
ncbi:MAG: NAD-binding oxidoreductase [Archangium sp.]|nr:NAD-binding oxidoreductase [Archangium sp.]